MPGIHSGKRLQNLEIFMTFGQKVFKNPKGSYIIRKYVKQQVISRRIFIYEIMEENSGIFSYDAGSWLMYPEQYYYRCAGCRRGSRPGKVKSGGR